ncbi:YciI family protein [Curtobacterium sp. A7_M15]|uniref:YciI family protein n=1 Tax=Curtobacterium sp. A7_M15 TaxID=3065241 RepID=UPI00273794D8|nr:YciI family protein [Curtobacterium sp. A7_M15]MDP4335215.1 YciI family protein [Curtobacterium sp. A7_M15]
MPHFVVLIHGGPSEPSPDDLAAHDRDASDLIDSGALVAAFAFGPASDVVRIDGDGPAPGGATATALDGIGVIEAPDLDAAVAIARRNPATELGGFVEVRPVAGSWTRGGGPASGSAPGVPTT